MAACVHRMVYLRSDEVECKFCLVTSNDWSRKKSELNENYTNDVHEIVQQIDIGRRSLTSFERGRNKYVSESEKKTIFIFIFWTNKMNNELKAMSSAVTTEQWIIIMRHTHTVRHGTHSRVNRKKIFVQIMELCLRNKKRWKQFISYLRCACFSDGANNDERFILCRRINAPFSAIEHSV